MITHLIPVPDELTRGDRGQHRDVLQNHIPDQRRLALGGRHHSLGAAEVAAVGLDDAAMRSASSRDANVNEVCLRVARSRNKTAYLTEPSP